MPIGVDDEAEPADVVFGGRDEEPALLCARTALAAERRDTLDQAGLLRRRDR
jgi:hypothetical protein